MAVGGRITQATIDAVRDRADLVELVEAWTGRAGLRAVR